MKAQNSGIKRTYHWYFGGKAGIDFSSGTGLADTNGQMAIYAGCATMSDTAGDLLMYTNGFAVWNKNHQIMPNGDSLMLGFGSTPYQSSIIIPEPGNENSMYYIFHLSAFNFKNKVVRGLFYSLVDMNLNGGLGDVTIKGQLLLTPVSEALGAVYHANCKDVWIMTHKRGTNDFYAFLLTKNGITDTVINTVGNFIGSNYGTYGLKFSPDGSKMATSKYGEYINNHTAFDTLHLLDFDRNSGILSNKILIPDTTIGAYGFSPDNTKLYVHQGFANAESYQYDISSNNQSVILSTKTLIYYDDYWNIGDFQNTFDGRIIGAKTSTKYVQIIENPNNLGTACNLVDSALFLNGRNCYVSLPNFMQSYFDTDTSTNCFTTMIESYNLPKSELSVFPNPFVNSTMITLPNQEYKSETFSVFLYDIIGKEHPLHYAIKKTSENIEIVLSRDAVTKEGMYFLKVQIKSQIYITKLIIIN
jgi:hypothetical protein